MKYKKGYKDRLRKKLFKEVCDKYAFPIHELYERNKGRKVVDWGDEDGKDNELIDNIVEETLDLWREQDCWIEIWNGVKKVMQIRTILKDVLEINTGGKLKLNKIYVSIFV